MFGPNTYFQDNVNICYSHRDNVFFDLFAETRQKFSEMFHLEDFDILFVPGSATVGIEALMFSFKHRLKVIGVEGTFKNRWTELAQTYSHKQRSSKEYEMFCLLETSRSQNFYKEGALVDAVSGFPYYDIPKNTIAFVTCLNKQIGSYVGLSVVGVRKDMWNLFLSEETMSYLNLARYRSYHTINQAPSTSPTYIYEHLNQKLEQFNIDAFRKRVDRVSKMVVDVIGTENIIGNACGPVITLKEGVIPEILARKYDIYGYWSGRPNYQIFTYSDKEENYIPFLQELSRIQGKSI